MSNIPTRKILALFPGALGDFLCCWPALDALRRIEGASLTLAAREAWFAALPENAVAPLSIDRREVADLFGAAPLEAATRAVFTGFSRIDSWTGHGDDNFGRRLFDAAGGATVAVHPFRALAHGEHASQYYARCIGVDAVVESLPVRASAAEWADDVWRRQALNEDALVIHAGSGSGRKNWIGMAELAAAWRDAGGTVVALSGPAEAEGRVAMPHDVALCNEPLDRVAAVLARAPRYLGNDSGISHLAGLIGARGVALFGPSDPAAWRPLGHGLRVLWRPHPCSRCGADRFCTHRLPVADVIMALRSIEPTT